MGLSEEELARIRRAYLAAGPHNLERLAMAKVRGERKALLDFIKAWDRLDIEERAAVSFELARLVSPDEDETGGPELALTVDPHDLDVGLAAFRAAEAGKEKGGNKVREPGFREAVQEAGKIWLERDPGHIWNPGNIHRDTGHYAKSDDFQPNPMLAFVCEAVARALPPAAIARATSARSPKMRDLWKVVHTQLRP